jgi:hypothetical protein
MSAMFFTQTIPINILTFGLVGCKPGSIMDCSCDIDLVRPPIAVPQLERTSAEWGDVMLIAETDAAPRPSTVGQTTAQRSEFIHSTSSLDTKMSKLSPCEEHTRCSLQHQRIQGSRLHPGYTLSPSLRSSMAHSIASIHRRNRRLPNMPHQIHHYFLT